MIVVSGVYLCGYPMHVYVVICMSGFKQSFTRSSLYSMGTTTYDNLCLMPSVFSYVQ